MGKTQDMKIINSSKILHDLIADDKKTFVYIAGYAIFISILYLALPLSTQLIINRITHTALIQPVLIISLILIILLALAGILNVLQKYLLEMYKRQSFVRITSTFFLKTAYADKRYINSHLDNELSSKYFEIFNIQNNLSILVIEGLLLVLQIVVGFIISSFYHPYIFIVNIITSIIIYATWKIFYTNSVKTSIIRSEKKYHVYSWFDSLLQNSSELNNPAMRDFSISKAKTLIAEYISARVAYWRLILAQIIILVVLSSLVMLSIFSVGSFLVISGQLSLGQLVAAEIIFTSSVFSISKLATYFDRYYELVSSIDKIHYLLDVQTTELPTITSPTNNLEHILEYRNVKVIANQHQQYQFDIKLGTNSLQYIKVDNEEQANQLITLVKYKRYLYDQVIPLDQMEHLEQQVYALENLDILPTALISYLANTVTPNTDDYCKINNLINQLALQNIINDLPEGINSTITNKYQISMRVIILLKIIHALMSNCKYIVIGGLVNVLEDKDLANLELVFRELSKHLIIINYKKS